MDNNITIGLFLWFRGRDSPANTFIQGQEVKERMNDTLNRMIRGIYNFVDLSPLSVNGVKCVVDGGGTY